MNNTQLDTFTRQYIETALWSSSCEAPNGGEGQLAEFYDYQNIAPETLQRMVADCKAFQEGNSNVLEIVSKICDDSRAGHNFWLNRNGHWSGFWDEDFGKDETMRTAFVYLSDAAKTWGSFNLYVGDDGQIHGR